MKTIATEIGLAWKKNADGLAKWILERMVNREDAYGSYYFAKSENKWKNCMKDGSVDNACICRHFASNEIIGLYTTSKDDSCRWLTIDLDRHKDDDDSVVTANDRFASDLYSRLREMGFYPLLSDSNGKGGRHLTVLFDEPLPARDMRKFGLWLVRDWREEGSGRSRRFSPNRIASPLRVFSAMATSSASLASTPNGTTTQGFGTEPTGWKEKQPSHSSSS